MERHPHREDAGDFCSGSGLAKCVSIQGVLVVWPGTWAEIAMGW